MSDKVIIVSHGRTEMRNVSIRIEDQLTVRHLRAFLAACDIEGITEHATVQIAFKSALLPRSLTVREEVNL